MTNKTKAADLRRGQAATKTHCIYDHNKPARKTWYATLEQCINGFTDRAVRLTGVQTLRSYPPRVSVSRPSSAEHRGHVSTWSGGHE